MKRLVIVIAVLMSIFTSTTSCCFNPFFYIPFEALDDVSSLDSQTDFQDSGPDAVPIESGDV